MSYTFGTLLTKAPPNIIVFSSTDTLDTITSANYIGDDWNTFLQEGDVVFMQYVGNNFGIFEVNFDSGNIYLVTNVVLGVNGSGVLVNYTNAITAHAGGGQANATQMTSSINRITTVATILDSVKLPAAVPGKRCLVINAAALNVCNIYPQSGESIGALSADSPVSLNADTKRSFDCAATGIWN